MNKKEILTIILLICVIFSLQAVVAADSGSDNTNSTVLSVDENVSSYALPSSETDTLAEVANADSFTDLSDQLDGASEVTLTKNYTYKDTDSFSSGITIDHNIVIDGQGDVIIDANNKSRVFFITAEVTNVTLKGITFINGNATAANGIAGFGGSIFARGVVHIDNCKFIDNTANYANGGAVTISGFGSTITNSYFEGNRAINKPGTETTGGAGAVFLNASNVTIKHSQFISNYAGLNGGAVGSSDKQIQNCTIANCTFTSNTANGSAGAVGMQSSNFIISNSTFKYNEAKGMFDSYPGNGGAMVMRGWDSKAYNCTFINNTAKQHGGAAYLTNTTYNPLNNNTGFELCTFINNTAGYNGGAVDWYAGATYGYILDSIFTNNTAKRSGGAIHWSGHYGTVSNSTFTNNTATGDVISEIGGITGGGDGGAIVWVGSHGIINDSCVFTNNYAKYRGGAIFLHGNSTENCINITIDSCKFNDNTANVNGGAIDFNRGAINGTVTNCNFTNNTAYRSAGAIFWFGTNGTIQDSNFTDNRALGIVEYTDSYGVLTYGGYGGAVMWTGPNGVVDNCIFIGNEAKYNEATNSGGHGGAVYLQGSDEGNCTNTTFSNCNFTSNIAGTNGGAIDWHEGAHDGTIFNSIFNNNIANSNGGAVYWRGHEGNISNSNFTNNTAKGMHPGSYGNVGDGGAIFWAGINGDVEDCRFIDNEAIRNTAYVTGGRGGAVYLESCAHGNKNTTFRNVHFENNIAGTNGGAIDWHEGAEDGLIDNGTFINNTAHRNGGAIFWHGQNGTIKNSRFNNNRATGDAHEYTIDINMGDTIVVEDNGNLILGNIHVIQSSTLPSATPTSSDANKLFVLNYTNGTNNEFKSYVAHNNGTDWVWLKLDEVSINVSESIISPVDWAIDQYFGGDGGTILWSGDIGLVYNCTFTDSNSARRGGGAYMTGSDNVTYNLCNFTNCTSGTNGGGVDWLAGANYGKIYNCIFNNTRAARSAGAIYYDGWYGDMQNITIVNTQSWGGALKESKDKLVSYAGWDSSHWDTNTTGGDAGAIMFTGSFIDVYNVTFTNCNASGRGGAVFLQDNHNVTFDLCKFENNIASGNANNTYNDDKNISSGINAWLTGYGGAVAFDVGATNGTIKNSKFINNTAYRNGGAISFGKGSSNANVYNSTFDNNTAYRNGGAISWDGTNGNMSYCNFTNNSALGTDINMEIFDLTNLGKIKNVTSMDEINSEDYLYVLVKADSYEMYVYTNNVPVKLETTNETGPSPTDWAMDEYFGGNGGSIYWRGDNGDVDNCRFIDSNSARRGGGAYMTGSDNITFQNSYFENCTSGTNGGGLDWLAGANNGKIINCIFNNTRAARSAGAIYYDGDYGQMINITIINATNYGGSLKQSKDGRVKYAGWDSSHWDTNTTGGDAGAIMITGDHLYMYNATFINCTSVGRGGAVFLQDNINATIELSRFENNYAMGNANNTWKNYTQERNDAYNDTKVNYKLTGHGGAIAFDVNAQNCTILSSEFINNLARRNGGAINFDEGSINNTIKHCNFTNNTVYDDGGAINFDHGSDLCSVYNSTFYNNTGLGRFGSTTKGGTICLTGSNITISDSTFILGVAYANTTEGANLSTTDAGALFVTGNYVNIINTLFDRCYSPNHAGAIKVIGNYTTIDNCTFENCNATEDGGALYVDGLECRVYNSTFINNTAGDDGGAINWRGADGYLYNITCINNKGISLGTSHSNGGTISLNGDNVTIVKSHFELSSALIAGGAIFITGNDVDIIDSSFEKCNVSLTVLESGKTYTTGGGSLYILGNNSNIINCTFERSNAREGGVIYVQGVNATINNVTTQFTFATRGGSIYISGVNANVSNSNISFSNATMSGGAVFIDGVNASVINSTFANTIAKASSDYIYVGTDNKQFSDSTMNNHGGAIYIKGDYALILDSQFELSHAYRGGALFLEGKNCNVTNSSVDDSSAYTDGGAVYSTGSNSTLSGSNFTNNSARGNGGSIFWYGGANSKYNGIINCIFANNTANGITSINTKGGGAVYWSEKGESGYIIGSKFINNCVNSTDKADGGAILWDRNSHCLIDDCIFDANYVTTTSTTWAQGGAIYFRSHNITISNSKFENCWSKKEAGAIYLSNDIQGITLFKYHDIYIVNTTFTNNTAKGESNASDTYNGGGALLIKQCGYFEFYNVTFENNTANQGGAVVLISAKNNYNNFTNCTFTGNNATGNGGGLWTDQIISLKNATFTDNVAGNLGGGMYNSNIMDYANLTFINNTAVRGGGLYWNRANVIIQNMTFENNTATEFGGAIFISQNNITVLDNNFTNNSAISGGAIYVNGNPTNVSYNNFTINKAQYGGAIFIALLGNANNVVTSYNNFTNNGAVYGGAIYSQVNGRGVAIDNSTFTENYADYGGAIYAGSKGFEGRYITYSNFTRNTANKDGGAVYISQVDQKISSCIFDGNNATGNGGSVCINNSVSLPIIEDSIFMNSHANNGGAIYNNANSSTSTKTWIDNDTFINNTAVHNGGAILFIYNKVSYRDYNNFDNRSVISQSTGRTNVSAEDRQKTLFIRNSLFENNWDYILEILPISDDESLRITIFLTKPNDVDGDSIHFVVNLTNSTTGELISQINVTPENYLSHFNPDPSVNMVYVTFDKNLIYNQNYNITVEFYDGNYLIKSNSTSAVAKGTLIGEFQLLQRQIESNITVQRQNNVEIYEIYLHRDYRFLEESNGVYLDNSSMNITNLDKPLIIHGNGWILDARGFSRIFNVTASNVTFDNIIFVDGNAGGKYNDSVNSGGAIYWAGEYGKLINSEIYNSIANNGGGIYYNSSANDCLIINSTFKNNTAATYGGAIDCNASRMGLENTTFESNHAYIGAALCREINATEGHGYNNTFIDNHAEYAGAALAWINSSSIRIDTYFFYDNTAGYSGGAIYVGEGSGYCVIENCVFENNNVTSDSDGHGGAIEWYAENGTVSNSNFTNNHAYDGGAIYVGSDSGKINITGSNFKENSAIATGGAVSLNASSVTINQSNFYDNSASEGGALYVGGDGETNYVYNSVFERNNATSGNGGAINWIASSGTIINSNLTHNNAMYGGGIYFGGLSTESVISRCIFTDNHAKYKGGAIDCNSSKMNLTHTLFDGNYAQFGAALCREINAQSGSGENNTFINNHAYVSGAALGWMGAIGIKITNYTFINNSADVSGGAIYVDQDSVNCSIIDSCFENNYVTNKTSDWDGDKFNWTAWDNTPMSYSIKLASESEYEYINKTIMGTQDTIYYYLGSADDVLGVGGAIGCFAANSTITNSKFINNTARLGGGIYVGADSGDTLINKSIFKSNVAYLRGGAVNLHASATHIDDSEFYDNIAINGSALYVGGIGTNNKVHGSVFEGNNATGYGAGIYWIAHEGEIKGSNFTNNNATYGGGIFFNGRSANTNITNSIFKLNNATKNGGAIECNASNIGIYNITFESNYAGEYGAALCREVGATGGHGKNNTFISNHVGIAGAALAWMGVDNININYYYFIDNTANEAGAAIYVSDDSDNCIINNSYFKGNNITNTTAGHGGAIYVVGDNATVVNSNFTNNHAFYGGAIFAGNSSGNTNISNVTFDYNGANVNGGAILITGSGVTLNDARFYNNHAGNSGGAVYVGGEGTSNVVWYTVFENNTANDHGGAINWLAYSGEVFYSNFTNNSAVYGGGIYLNHISSSSKIVNVIFKENKASKNGGGIDCNASYMGLNNTQFISNYAGEYGAALCREAGAEHGYGGNNTFISNHAEISGAALAWLDVDGISINNYTFYNNTAQYSGGAIYVSKDSSDCKVSNSTFTLNYVIDVLSGRGGVIDWLGDNGLIYNSTFDLSYAIEGGALYITSNNMNITKSNFSYAISLERGGTIVADNANNASITDCIFDNSAAIGYITPENKDFGQGGAIYWINSDNLTISNTKFYKTESHADGAIYLMNCNNSRIYDVLLNDSLSIRSGGSISWINSTNGTIDNCTIIKSEALYNGGAINLVGVDNITVKNSKFNSTRASKANGGSIYIDGNVTIDNNTFEDYEAYGDWGASLYFHNGTSSVINSTFNGEDAIWVYNYATVNLTANNVTGKHPNKNTTYLVEAYDSKYNPVDYSVWNDGILYLDKNNFDYVIFNNGTIMTQTYMYVLDNETWEREWNTSFFFWANITDDNSNTIISVKSLNTYNDHKEFENYTYFMPYNRINLDLILQDNFVIFGNDTGLAKCEYHPGTIKVKMPTKVEIIQSEEINENIIFTAKITTPFDSNHTIEVGKQVHFKFNNHDYYGNISCVENIISGNVRWTVAYANITLNHVHTGTYTMIATFEGDSHHFGCENNSLVVLNARPIRIAIEAADIYYGQTLICNVTSNATNTENGWIFIRINGKEIAKEVKLEKNGTKIVPITYDEYKDIMTTTGEYTISVMFNNGTYYDYQINFSTFNVKKFDTDIIVNATNITYGENEIINVTVDETASGFISVRIGDQIYTAYIRNGNSIFNISGLAVGTYTANVTFYPDDGLFNRKVTNVTFRVDRTNNLKMDVKVDDVSFHDNATIRVLLNTTAGGNVTIYVDNMPGVTVNVTDGLALLNVSDLAAGEHVVNVTYNGDSSFAPKDFNGTTFTVKQYADWKMNITTDERPYGENTTITITLPDDLMAQNVTIRIDGITYVVNVTYHVANLTLNNLSAGTHNANVTAGDANHANKTQVFRPQIAKAEPVITITIDDDDVIATVTGNVTGNVTFYINGVKSENVTVDGVATVKDKLVIGTNTIIAVYDEDQNHTMAYKVETVNIVEISTSLTVVASPVDVVSGSNARITVTMVNVTTGRVLIELNGYNYTVDIKDGVAILDVDLPLGDYTPKAYYLGDLQHKPSNGTGNEFTVFKYPTTINVTATGNNVGGDANITVNVTEGATGYVVVNVNGTNYTINLTNGEKSIIIPGLGNGTYYVYATYLGDDTHLSSTNTTETFTINSNPSKVNVTATSVVYGNDSAITVKVPTVQTGYVTITVNDTLVNVTVKIVDGEAKFNASGLNAGRYIVNVTYLGDKVYEASENFTYFDIIKANLTTVAIAQNVSVRENVSFIINVNDDFDGKVRIDVGGIKYDDAPNSLIGIGKFESGTYTATVTFYGSQNYNDTTFDVEFTVSRVVPTVDVTIEDVIYPNNATAVIVIGNKANGTVNITVDGNVFNGTVYNGEVNVNLTGLSAGNSKVATVQFFTGDNYNDNVTATVKFNVNKANSTIVIDVEKVYIYNETILINLTATGSDGAINVTINGKVYPVNDQKQVEIKNITAGEYTIIAKLADSENYTSAVNSTTFKVKKAGSSISIDVNSIYKVGEDIVITLDAVNSTDLTVTINGEKYDVVGNQVTIPGGLEAGDYIINAVGACNENYTASNDTKSFSVVKYDISVTLDDIITPIVAGNSVRFTANLNESVTGDVIFNINGANYTVHVSDAAVATYDYVPTNNATLTVVATFTGNDKYNRNASAQKQFNVNRNTTGIELSVATPVTYGDAAVITVTMDPSINATVIVKVDGEDYPVAVVNGEGKLKVYGLNATAHKVNVTFDGDETFLPCNDTAEFTIGKASAGLNVVVENVTYGEKVPVTIFVNGTGNVTIEIEGLAPKTLDLVNGNVEDLIEGLDAGNYTVKVTYNGNDNINSTVVETNFTIEKADPAITVNVEDIIYGDTEHIIITSNASGNVTVKINGEIKVVELTLENGHRAVLMASRWNVPTYDGKATVDVSGLDVGRYPVEVIYNGNNNYNEMTVDTHFNVIKANSTVEIEIDQSIRVGESQMINVTVDDSNAAGKVVIIIDGKNYTVNVTEGKANFTTPVLPAGNHSIVVIYEGDDNHNGNWTSVYFDVEGLETTLTVDTTNITVGETETINVHVSDNANGMVLIDINGQTYYVNLTGGEGSLTLDNLDENVYSVTATYLGDENHTSVSNETEFNVTKNTSTIDIVAEKITFGDNEVIIFNVPEDATGNLTVKVNGTTYTVAVSGGKGNLTIPNLKAGNYTVDVTYNGDNKYESTTKSAEFEVAKANVEASDIKVIDQGNGSVVVVVPEDCTGNVTITVDGENYTADVKEGIATIAIDKATPGTHAVDVTYSGDDNHKSISKADSITLTKLTAPISVDVTDIEAGDDASVVVNVPDGASGNVTIEIDGVKYTEEVKNGKATFTIPNLSVGNKTIAVEYDGDDTFVSNHTTDKITVSKRKADIEINIHDIDAGDNVTVTVTGPSDATGQVLIDIGGVGYYVNLTNGKATAQIPRVPSGIYNVSLTYTGDEKYLGSTDSKSLNVSKVESFVIPSAENITVDDDEVITVTVPVDATGNVTLVINGTEYNYDMANDRLSARMDEDDKLAITVHTGNGIVVISNLPSGAYSVFARYNGDEKYLASTNTTAFTVSKKEVTLNIVDQGNGTVNVYVDDDAKGNVTIKIGNSTYTAKIADGVAVFNFENETPGNYSIEAVYSGDSEHYSQTNTSVISIPARQTPLDVDVSYVQVGDVAEITVTLPEDATGNVTITVDGTPYTTKVKNGKAVFKIPGLTSGVKTLDVSYSGDDKYPANSTESNFTVYKAKSKMVAVSQDIKVGNDEVITITLPDDATGRVYVTIGDETYYGNVIKGKAKIRIHKLLSGEYKLSAFYEGDDKYLPTNSTVSFTVTKSSSPISIKGEDIKQGNDETIVVKLPKDATGTVTIKINGKQYTAKVKDGKAVFVISGLPKGNYKVIAKYSGDDKYSPSESIINIDVYGGNGHSNNSDINHRHGGVDLSVHETGNPIMILLLILLAIATTQIRRFRK